jgi:hypothetical protein
MEDPRRLIICGKDPSDNWNKVLGRTQKTVVSHRLRHVKRSAVHDKKLLGDTTSGPVIEGGEGVTMTAAEDPDGSGGIPERIECDAFVDEIRVMSEAKSAKFDEARNSSTDGLTEDEKFDRFESINAEMLNGRLETPPERMPLDSYSTKPAPEGALPHDRAPQWDEVRRYFPDEEKFKKFVRYGTFEEIVLAATAITAEIVGNVLTEEETYAFMGRVSRALGYEGDSPIVQTQVFMADVAVQMSNGVGFDEIGVRYGVVQVGEAGDELEQAQDAIAEDAELEDDTEDEGVANV